MQTWATFQPSLTIAGSATREAYRIGGNSRISDGKVINHPILGSGLVEVKNAKELSLNSQIRDAIARSTMMGEGATLKLCVREDTILSGPLAKSQ